MVQKSIRLVSPPASKQKVYYIVTSAFYDGKKKMQICYTVPRRLSAFFSPMQTEAKEQTCSFNSTETTHKKVELGTTDRPVSVSCLQSCVKNHKMEN